jgi:hypothetical protein
MRGCIARPNPFNELKDHNHLTRINRKNELKFKMTKIVVSLRSVFIKTIDAWRMGIQKSGK